MAERTILVVGIGAGNPEHVTVQAINALNRCDVFFIPDKGEEKSDLAGLRHEILSRHATAKSYRVVTYAVPRRDEDAATYRKGVDDWHDAIAAGHRTRIESELEPGQTGAFLVWGDPSLYDSTLRLIDRLRAGGLDFDCEVVPGITSVQALAASHAMPLNTIGGPVLLTTGRRLAQDYAAAADTLVVMLDGDTAFRSIAEPAAEVWWGAYLGTPDEIVVAGRVGEVGDEIARLRAEARERKGWIMDTYMLRKPPR